MFFIKKNRRESKEGKRSSDRKDAQINSLKPSLVFRHSLFVKTGMDGSKKADNLHSPIESLKRVNPFDKKEEKRDRVRSFGPRPFQSKSREQSPLCQPSTQADFDGLFEAESPAIIRSSKPRLPSRVSDTSSVPQKTLTKLNPVLLRACNQPPIKVVLPSAFEELEIPAENELLYESFTRFEINERSPTKPTTPSLIKRQGPFLDLRSGQKSSSVIPVLRFAPSSPKTIRNTKLGFR